MRQFTHNEQAILIGMFISKYDIDGLNTIGFNGFTEAFNAIGFSLGIKPLTIRNYRDEFDALYPNSRKGWHNRPMRTNCRAIYEEFNSLNFSEILEIIKNFINIFSAYNLVEEENQTFAKRLVTGLAAEHFFKSVYQEVPLFKGLALEDRTNDGCGYDFKLFSAEKSLGVEVKGLSEQHGNIMMTEKEYKIASLMKENYFLFIAKNFITQPDWIVYQNPVGQPLNFRLEQRQIIVSNWSFSI